MRQVLQIAVWRADAVTFVCWWCATLYATGLERRVLSLWLHHTELERSNDISSTFTSRGCRDMSSVEAATSYISTNYFYICIYSIYVITDFFFIPSSSHSYQESEFFPFKHGEKMAKADQWGNAATDVISCN